MVYWHNPSISVSIFSVLFYPRHTFFKEHPLFFRKHSSACVFFQLPVIILFILHREFLGPVGLLAHGLRLVSHSLHRLRHRLTREINVPIIPDGKLIERLLVLRRVPLPAFLPVPAVKHLQHGAAVHVNPLQDHIHGCVILRLTDPALCVGVPQGIPHPLGLAVHLLFLGVLLRCLLLGSWSIVLCRPSCPLGGPGVLPACPAILPLLHHLSDGLLVSACLNPESIDSGVGISVDFL